MLENERNCIVLATRTTLELELKEYHQIETTCNRHNEVLSNILGIILGIGYQQPKKMIEVTKFRGIWSGFYHWAEGTNWKECTCKGSGLVRSFTLMQCHKIHITWREHLHANICKQIILCQNLTQSGGSWGPELHWAHSFAPLISLSCWPEFMTIFQK